MTYLKGKENMETLQITITKAKTPKTRLGKWWYWNVYWTVWKIWRPKFNSWFFGGLANLFDRILPEEYKEDFEFQIKIKDER